MRIIKIAGFAALILGLTSPVFSGQALSREAKARVQGVQEAIKAKGARWEAGETSVSDRPWKSLGGLDILNVTGDLEELPAAREELPAALDWRSLNGNFVTKSKDQGDNCNSCWAFAMTGALESYTLRRLNKPGMDLDLSEQVMLSCSGAGSCGNGIIDPTFIQKTGLPPDSAYPYIAYDGKCSKAAAGWQNSAYKIDGWARIPHDLVTLKTALVHYGPLPVAMMVYEDLVDYRSGVYSYVTGEAMGGHGVLLVGYNDAGKYFIAKNSWGAKWGEHGFFRIAYSELESEVKFAVNAVIYKTAPPALTPAVTGNEAAKRMAPLFDGTAAWK